MRNILIALFFTIVVFSAGLYIGTEVTERKQSVFYSSTQDLFLQTLSAELEFELLKEQPCLFIRQNNLDLQLEQLENRLSYLEQISHVDKDEFRRLKNQYFLVEIRHYLLFLQANQVCDQRTDLILYFYGDKTCDDCDNQGVTLLSLRRKYDTVRVYSFDVNSDNGAVKALLSQHNITQVPSVVINGATHHGFISYAALESLVAR
jgi:glutaredoxin